MLRVASQTGLHRRPSAEKIYEDCDFEQALEHFLSRLEVFPNYINHISWRLGKSGHWKHIAMCPISEHLLQCYVDMYRVEKGKPPYFFKE